MSNSKKHVNLFGAGLVGSVMGILLAEEGHTVDIYERRPDMRKAGAKGGRSINLALSDRGWKALAKVGLDETVRQMALSMEGRMLHDQSGKQDFVPYGKTGQAIYSVSRGKLNELLIDSLEQNPNSELFFEHRLTELDFASNKAQLEYTPTGKHLNAEADYSIAADGAFSAARLNMQMNAGFNYSQSYLPYGYKELTIPPTSAGDFALNPKALHIWPRHQFMLIALPNPDKSFTCTLFHFYEEQDQVPGFNQLKHAEGVQAFFQKYFPDAMPLMPQLLEDFSTNPVGSLVTIRTYPWKWGKTLLIGDASHAIVPFYGQGMNAGFEDCSLLMPMLQENPNWDEAFEAFQQKRKPDADAIADLALENFKEMRSKVANEHFKLQKEIEQAMAKHFPNEWKTLYSLVTFSHEPYHYAQQQGKLHDRFFQEYLFPGKTKEELEAAIGNPERLAQWIEAFKKWKAEQRKGQS